MKFSPDDIRALRTALATAKVAGLESAVITKGLIGGMHEKMSAVLFSPIKLLETEYSMGMTRLPELEKRLALFGDDVLIEGELNDAGKMRILRMKGKAGKIEYRCTDERLIKYPKTNPDEPNIVVTISKPEIALLSKGVKLMGAAGLVFQIKRDGGIHLECQDESNDRFEMDLEMPAAFLNDETTYVNTFDLGTGSPFMPLLDHMAKESDKIEIVIMASGNVSTTVYGHTVFAVPHI